MSGALPVSPNCGGRGWRLNDGTGLTRMQSPDFPGQSSVSAQEAGPVIAATDYVRAVPDLIRTWVPHRYVTLGTDGFGRSDTRAALRGFFEVDRTSIALAAISVLADDGAVNRSAVSDFMARYGYQPPVTPPWADRRLRSIE